MRTALAFILASLLPIACAPSTQGPACPSWEVLDRVAGEGSQDAYANALVVDGQDNFFYDVFFNPGLWTWVVRKSADHGRTWTTADWFQIEPNRFNYPLGMTVDARGRVFVAGVVSTEHDTRGMIRTTADEGLTWTVADYYLHPGSTDCKIYNVKRVDTALFGMGRCETGGNTHWLLRRSLDAGVTWSTVDFPHEGRPQFSKAFDIAKAKNGTLLTLGIADTDTGNRVFIRKSVDAGDTWSDVASYQVADGADDVVGGLTVTSKGSLLINQWVIDKNRYGFGAIRRSIDNGNTWTMVDAYRHADDLTLYSAISEDEWGRVFVLATTAEPAKRQGILRESRDDGATWRDVGDVFGENGQPAGFTGMYIHGGHDMLVTGSQGTTKPFAAVVMRLRLLPPDTSCHAS